MVGASLRKIVLKTANFGILAETKPARMRCVQQKKKKRRYVEICEHVLERQLVCFEPLNISLKTYPLIIRN